MWKCFPISEPTPLAEMLGNAPVQPGWGRLERFCRENSRGEIPPVPILPAWFPCSCFS